ncbi:MAG TPA: PaaI family thioesterase, partial [Candidatus Melainabacteria bacterium]|nr:PaaI family thioesterase [Candidatus Melainabacteria bacterium]
GLEWGQISPTLELKVSMLNAARPGRIIGTGRVIKRGKSVGFIEGENAVFGQQFVRKQHFPVLSSGDQLGGAQGKFILDFHFVNVARSKRNNQEGGFVDHQGS